MEIRKSTLSDIEDLMAVFDSAKAYMAATGNPNQWKDGYPQRELVIEDITSGDSYIIEEKASETYDSTNYTVGTFVFRVGEDPSYKVCLEGQWKHNEPYGVIHRLAGNGKGRGLMTECLKYCFDRIGYIRIDTHNDNKVMQKLLADNGFEQTCIIRGTDGDIRLGYEKKLR